MIRKYLSVLLTVCTIILMLSGCHGSKSLPEFEIPEEFDTSREYRITFWAKNDTNKTQADIYERAILNFERLYPNIRISLRLYTDYSKIFNDVITNLSTNTTPNVCITYPDHISTYLAGVNTVVPLEELFEDEEYGLGGSKLRFDAPTKDEIIPKFLDECLINGKYYAMPFMRSTEACYVNKTYVEALGFELPETLTWDFVWEVSEAAMAQDDEGNYLVNGQKVMIPFIYKSTDNMMIQALKQQDANYSTPEGDILLFNDTTKKFLYTVSDHAKTGAFSTFKISSYPANFLNAGQCIFAVDSTAGATWMGTDAPLSDISEENLVEFETAVMTIPQFDTENPKMISQGPSLCVFNKSDSQEVMASWLFAQYLLTNDVQISYAQTEGYVPVTSKAQESEEYINYISRMGEDNSFYYDVKIKASKLLMNNVDNTFVTPVFRGSASLREAAGQMIESVVKSTRRNEAINESYMTKLFYSVNSLYRLDQSGTATPVKASFGRLPLASKILLLALIAAWAVMVISLFYDASKKRKN